MLRRFGNVHYVSKRLKYVVLYCDLADTETIMEKINSYSFVKKLNHPISRSLKRNLKIQTGQG